MRIPIRGFSWGHRSGGTGAVSRRRAGVTDTQNYHTPDPRRINSPAKKLYRRVDVRHRAAGGNAVAAPRSALPLPICGAPDLAHHCHYFQLRHPRVVYVAANLAPTRPDEVTALNARLDAWWKS